MRLLTLLHRRLLPLSPGVSVAFSWEQLWCASSAVSGVPTLIARLAALVAARGGGSIAFTTDFRVPTRSGAARATRTIGACAIIAFPSQGQ